MPLILYVDYIKEAKTDHSCTATLQNFNKEIHTDISCTPATFNDDSETTTESWLESKLYSGIWTLKCKRMKKNVYFRHQSVCPLAVCQSEVQLLWSKFSWWNTFSHWWQSLSPTLCIIIGNVRTVHVFYSVTSKFITRNLRATSSTQFLKLLRNVNWSFLHTF